MRARPGHLPTPGLCLKTTHDYDALGNRSSTKQENCTGATGLAVIAPAAPTATAAYAAVAAQTITVGTGTTTVAIAAGIFATTSTNAQGHTETRKYDPRLGAVLEATLSGMSGMASSWRVDDFGRKTVEQRPDGTRTVVAYCVIGAGLSTSSNSSTANGDPMDCPTPATDEAPDTAASFVHSEPRDAGSTGFGAKMGPYVRIYSDRLGREVRTVTESFNGAGQTSGRAGVAVAQDSVYNAYLDARARKVLAHHTSEVTLHFDPHSVQRDDLMAAQYLRREIRIRAAAECAILERYARKTILTLVGVRESRAALDQLHVMARQFEFQFENEGDGGQKSVRETASTEMGEE